MPNRIIGGKQKTAGETWSKDVGWTNKVARCGTDDGSLDCTEGSKAWSEMMANTKIV